MWATSLNEQQLRPVGESNYNRTHIEDATHDEVDDLVVHVEEVDSTCPQGEQYLDHSERVGGEFMTIAVASIRRGAAFAFGFVLALTPAPARAEILAGATNTTSQVFGCGTFSIDLNGSTAGTNLRFTLPDANVDRRLSVLFNAECSVAAGNDATWLDIRLQLLREDGSVVFTLAPSDGGKALCTSTGDGTLEHWVSASTNTYTLFPSGPAVPFQVRAVGILRGCVAGNQWRVDDTATIVTR